MIKHMDDSGIFPQKNGPPPFLILDVHGSRFDILFLEYINNPIQNWTVCIGVLFPMVQTTAGRLQTVVNKKVASK